MNMNADTIKSIFGNTNNKCQFLLTNIPKKEYLKYPIPDILPGSINKEKLNPSSIKIYIGTKEYCKNEFTSDILNQLSELVYNTDLYSYLECCTTDEDVYTNLLTLALIKLYMFVSENARSKLYVNYYYKFIDDYSDLNVINIKDFVENVLLAPPSTE